MKSLLALFLISVSYTGLAQQFTHINTDPYCYLDSVKIEISKMHFDYAKIADVNVLKYYDEATKQRVGKVFITSKDPKSFNFQNINSLTHQYTTDDKTPVIYMLNNEFIKDTAQLKIDSSYVLNVELTKGSEINYVKNTLAGLTIIKILTRTANNVDRKSQIRIRGRQTASLKD